jgi:hypothetical protein
MFLGEWQDYSYTKFCDSSGVYLIHAHVCVYVCTYFVCCMLATSGAMVLVCSNMYTCIYMYVNGFTYTMYVHVHRNMCVHVCTALVTYTVYVCVYRNMCVHACAELVLHIPCTYVYTEICVYMHVQS